MNEKERLLTILNSDKAQNYDAISALKFNDPFNIEYFDEGVCFYAAKDNEDFAKRNGTYYIVHKKQSTLDHFIKTIGSCKEIIVTNYLPNQWESYDLAWKSVCHQFVYDNIDILCEQNIDGIHFSKLLEKDFNLAHETYTFKDSISLEDFSEHIVNGYSVAAYDIENNMCGFIGTHGDGSMGMLEVLPQFRRKHIGEELEKRLINSILKDKNVPYCHVVYGNEKSFNLQVKLGGTLCDNLIVFLELK